MTGPRSVIRRPPVLPPPDGGVPLPDGGVPLRALPGRNGPYPAQPPPSRYPPPSSYPPPSRPAPTRRPMPGGRSRPGIRVLPDSRPLPTGVLAMALLLIGLFAVGAGLGQATGFSIADVFRGAEKPPPLAFPVLEPSRPLQVEIPAIKVKAPLMDVGLTRDGTAIDVPPLKRHNEAGWFDQGPTPGQFGPAVIVGHADTRTGPSVFAELGKLRPGQRIEVLRRDHRVAVFEVNSVEHFNKSRLPVDRVYGDFKRPSLRLMTCGGKWIGGRTGYSDNVVVFASLVSSRRT